jgi:hypothetical protein
MKKIFFLFGIFYFIMVHLCYCQKKIKEGVAIFEMKRTNSEIEPIQRTVYFKNGNIRTEGKIMNKNEINIYSKDSNCQFQFTEGDTSKMVEKLSYRKRIDSGCEVSITNEIKIIAGLKCNKVIICFKEDKDTLELWLTDEIDAINPLSYNINDINGFMMEIKDYKEIYSPYMICVSFKKRKVKNKLFKLPEGSKIFSNEHAKFVN